MANIPHGNPGLAQGVDAENYQSFEAFLSDRPAAVTRKFVLKKSGSDAVTHELYTVMAIDATGAIHQAADSTDRTDDGCARAILAGKYTQPASSGSDTECEAYIEGHFNIDALVWNAAFDNDAKKLAAFDSFGTSNITGAVNSPFTNPGTIVVGVNPYHRKT
jgi:hypothetical protein